MFSFLQPKEYQTLLKPDSKFDPRVCPYRLLNELDKKS